MTSTWLVEHRDYVEGRQFRDLQLKGPFARWEHTHRFEPDGPERCRVIDEIDVRAPQVLPQGKRLDSLVQLIDLAPTIMDVLGLEPEKRFRGKSLRPVFEEQVKQLHEAIVLEVPFPFHREEIARIVRTQDWKYIEYTPPKFGKRVKKYFKELGRFMTLLVRPGMLSVLYGHHFKKGPLGFLKALYVDPYLFLSGAKTRRLFYLKHDPGEHHDVKGSERDTANKMQAYLQALNEASAPGRRRPRQRTSEQTGRHQPGRPGCHRRGEFMAGTCQSQARW